MRMATKMSRSSSSGFEVLTEVAMKAAIFWIIAPCSPYMKRRFEGTYHAHLQGQPNNKSACSWWLGRINQPVGITAVKGLESKRRGIAPTFICSLLFLAWLTGRSNGK
jgi:hypothetical protein